MKPVRDVTCQHCGVPGRIVLKEVVGDTVTLDDHIPHAEGCPLSPAEQPRHLKRKAWRRQENRANALVGAQETLASGAVNEDGDGRLFHEWRVESKGTASKKYILSQKVWGKLVQGALVAGEEPLLHIEIGKRGYLRRFCVVRAVWAPAHYVVPSMVESTRLHVTEDFEAPCYATELTPEALVLTERDFQRLKDEVYGHH